MVDKILVVYSIRLIVHLVLELLVVGVALEHHCLLFRRHLAESRSSLPSVPRDGRRSRSRHHQVKHGVVLLVGVTHEADEQEGGAQQARRHQREQPETALVLS